MNKYTWIDKYINEYSWLNEYTSVHGYTLKICAKTTLSVRSVIHL